MLQQQLTTPEAHAVALHPADAPGLVTLALRDGKRWRQHYVHPADLPTVARGLRLAPDVYLTQHRYTGPRAIARLLHLSALWADLDYYRVPELAGRHPWHVRDHALALLRDAGVPAPGLAIATGRGLCLLWRHSPVPRQALPRWQACQRRIWVVLRDLGADPLALDAARVLRLIGTTNAGAGGVLVEALSPLGPAWPWEELAREVLELGRGELEDLEARRRRLAGREPRTRQQPNRQLNGGTYWETVLTDLQRLRAHRWFGSLPPGQRDAWMLLGGIAASWLTPVSALRRELYHLAHECASWDQVEARSRLAAVISRGYAAARGETIEYDGRQVDPRYRVKAATAIKWLGIDEAEMRAARLRVLVSADVSREMERQRWHERRAAAGRPDRQAYRDQGQERRQQVLSLRSQGKTWAEVANLLGIGAEAARSLARYGGR